MTDLMFLHGAGDSGAVWDLQVDYFRPRHRVMALDFPGHGKRLREEAFDTVAENAEEVARAAHVRGFRHPVIVGHSMGGATALQVALSHPTLPKAIVLAGSGARLRMRPEMIEAATQQALTSSPGQVVKRLVTLESALSANATERSREWLREHFGYCTGQATLADFRATDSFDLMGRIGEIQVPVLIVGGEDDKWTPTKFQQYLAAQLPHARLVLMPAAGHYPFVEASEAFNEALQAFVEEIDPGPVGSI